MFNQITQYAKPDQHLFAPSHIIKVSPVMGHKNHNYWTDRSLKELTASASFNESLFKDLIKLEWYFQAVFLLYIESYHSQ